MTNEAVRQQAVDIARAIVTGRLTPIEGAKKIWWDIWMVIAKEEGEEEELLRRFVGNASEWEDHPDARPEIEEGIRQVALRVVERWE